ncbi:MAG: nitrous oxide reductase family maturation protein NosD [Pseudobdellovibrionaceae bacterium]
MKINFKNRFLKFIFSLSFLYSLSSEAIQNSLDVCATCSYTTVQAAIEAATDDAEIHIHPGIYNETNIIVDKRVQIIGAKDHASVFDGQDREGIFLIKTSGVAIRGLRLINTGYAATRDIAAIRVENTKDCLVDDNEIVDSSYAVYLAKVSSCSVLRNQILTHRSGATASGSGIHVWSGKNITIANNDIQGHRDGIYFEFVESSQIVDNFSHSNLRYGLHFMFSNSNNFQRNRFIRNESGVAVMYSKNIVMKANRFEQSNGAASYGILLKDISGSLIHGNLFGENTTGMYVEGTTHTQVIENDFIDNGWALRLVSSSDENNFVENNFLANTFEVTALPGWTTNTFERNYWSHYQGLDLDHDGIGDLPYRPVRLSAVWMQTIDGASLLLNSFFMSILDQAESVIPSITPDHIMDPHPLIRRRE